MTNEEEFRDEIKDVPARPVRMRIVRGLGTMATLQVLGAILNFVTLVVLARLLSPQDFGIVAIASLVTGLVGTFGDFGLGPAVIQRQDRVTEALYTANTMFLGISIGLFATAVLIAPAAAGFFSAPDSVDAIRLAAVLFILNSVAFMPTTRLRKELKFGVLLQAYAISSAVSAAVSISLAYLHFSFWSIIVASLVAGGVNIVVFVIRTPWKFSLSFDRKIARDILDYGKHMFLMNVFVFFILNADSAFVAYSLGTVAVGFYALAYKWANVPVNFLSKVTAQVMTPAYVLLRDSQDRLRKGYLETVLMVASVSIPVYVALLLVADDFVAIALGSQWLPIVWPLRILCVLGLVRGVAEPGGYLFLSTGRSRLMSWTTGIHLIAVVVFLVPGAIVGSLSGIAAAVALAYIVNAVVIQRYVRRLVGVSWADIVLILRGPFVAAAGMVLVMLAIVSVPLPPELHFFVAVGVGGISYLVLLRMFGGGILTRYLREVIAAIREP